MADPALEATHRQRRALGWGLDAPLTSPGGDHGRDLSFTPGATGRVLSIVQGIENLAQGLGVALTTLLGSDVFNVRFGFDGLNALAEETNPVIARERIRVAVIQVLRQDPRVRKVLDVRLAAESADRRRLRVDVVFETVTGESVTVKLGKEVGYA